VNNKTATILRNAEGPQDSEGKIMGNRLSRNYDNYVLLERPLVTSTTKTSMEGLLIEVNQHGKPHRIGQR